MGKRKFTRVPFKTEAMVKSKSDIVSGEVENLSLNGMFLKNANGLKADDDVEISISLSGDTTELAINLSGQVIRLDKEGIAIQFNMKGIDIDSFIHLRNIIAYNRGEQETVMQEYFDFLNNRSSSDS
jgi:hypothetical protein